MLLANNPQPQQLLALLRQPQAALELSLSSWNWLIPFATLAGVMPRLAYQLEQAQITDQLPDQVQWRFQAEVQRTRQRQTLLNWELLRLGKVLASVDCPLVLLKGAAYAAAQLPPRRGRIAADLDLLVPSSQLATIEQHLAEAGWDEKQIEPGHAAYFRRWLHEIPPIRHWYRGVDLDLHHNLLPGTDRLQFDCTDMISNSVPLAGCEPFRVLAPADMVIHSCIHLLRNGDFSHGLRDLIDIDLLLRHFATEAGFWQRLIDRVNQYHLQQPCWLALNQVREQLKTPLPENVSITIQKWQPRWLRRTMFHKLVPSAVFPGDFSGFDRKRSLSLWLLSHSPLPRWRAVLTPLFWLKRFPVHSN